MKKIKQLSLTTLIILSLTCCKKKDNRQYSYWYVNNDSFSTNDIRVDAGFSRHQLSGNDFSNRYFLYFNGSNFPTWGDFKMDCSQQNPAWVCFVLNYKHISYFPDNGYLHANISNEKAQYILTPTWFYNENQHNDSVLVHGIFNEP